MPYFRAALFAASLLATTAAFADDALHAAIASSERSAKFVARDGARHPYEELSFFGVTPSSTVVEIWPGGGYWTEILAPYLHDHGTYFLALGAADGDKTEAYYAKLSAPIGPKFTSEPGVYGNVKQTVLALHHDDIAPPGSADFVLTFRNLHNWMKRGDAAEVLAAIHTALKPGGILGIEDHRARPTKPQDATADSGYVRQDYAVQLIEKAGFKLVGSSEIDANPKDTTDWPQGVWTLPPTYALGDTDRAKYAAVGEADNFVLKFRKVGG